MALRFGKEKQCFDQLLQNIQHFIEEIKSYGEQAIGEKGDISKEEDIKNSLMRSFRVCSLTTRLNLTQFIDLF